jgi:hypothetical protein
VGSGWTPEGPRTTRKSSALGRVTRQPMQVRAGCDSDLRALGLPFLGTGLLGLFLRGNFSWIGGRLLAGVL